MKKKDHARAWRKFPLRLKGSCNKNYEPGFYEDRTEDIERSMLLNAPGRRVNEDRGDE